MGALTEDEECRLLGAEHAVTMQWVCALARRLAGRVEELETGLFQASEGIGTALCSLLAKDHQTREILEATRIHVWTAQGVELPAPTAPREAAKCAKCDQPLKMLEPTMARWVHANRDDGRTHDAALACPTPTESTRAKCLMCDGRGGWHSGSDGEACTYCHGTGTTPTSEEKGE